MASNFVYCNPNAISDGTGTLLNPYNTYTGKTLNQDDTEYKIFADSAHNGAIDIVGSGSSQTSRITLGKHGSGANPIILPNGAARTVRVGTGGAGQGNNVTIRDLDIHGGNSAGALTNFCLTFGFSATPVVNGEVINCVIHDLLSRSASLNDHNGLNYFGDNLFIEDVEVYDILEDGVWIDGRTSTATATVRRLYSHDVDQGGKKLGDCLQLLDVPNGLVEDCILDHSNVASKQALVWNETAGGSGGVVRNTVMTMAPDPGAGLYSCVFSNMDGLRVEGCWLFGGNYGIQFTGSNSEAVNNIIIGAERGIVGTSAGSGRVYMHNLLELCTTHGIYADSATDTTRNNIMRGCGVGLSRHAGSTYSNNAYWKNTTESAFIGASGSAEANTITSNPRLDQRYRPTLGSPLLGRGHAGSLSYVTTDIRGRAFRNPPTIGPYELSALDQAIWRGIKGRVMNRYLLPAP